MFNFASDMKDNSLEKFPIVDEEGRVIGEATRGECHSGSKLLHPVVHLHVFNSRGDRCDELNNELCRLSLSHGSPPSLIALAWVVA